MKDHHQSSSTVAVVTIVCVLVLLLVGGIAAVFVGGVFVFRSQARETAVRATRAMEMQQRAVAEAQIDLAVEQQILDAQQRVSQSQSSVNTLTIIMDSDGAIIFDGETVELANLQDALRAAAVDKGNFAITIQAHPECRFDEVIRVQTACTGAGITEIELAVAK